MRYSVQVDTPVTMDGEKVGRVTSYDPDTGNMTIEMDDPNFFGPQSDSFSIYIPEEES